MRCHVLVAVALALLGVGCASTGSVRGTVTIPGTAPSSAPTPAGLHAQAAPRVGEVVVYVQETPAESHPDPHRLPRSRVIEQTSHRFKPSVVPVEVGAEVAFENRDRVYHSVFSVSPVKTFDLGMYAPGHRSKNVTFDKTGQVDLFSSLDASMAGYLPVLPPRYFAQPDAAGNFKLPPLPPGSYTIKAWHPLFGTASATVDVVRGRSVTTQLKVPPR